VSYFKDSEIKFSCGRTKTETLVNNVLAPHALTLLVANLNAVEFFGISSEASNHGATKMFPVVVQYFQWSKEIETQVFE
jgi:hypothetical protein